MSLLMLKHDCCVNICHSQTPRDVMIKQIGEADILVACCGQPDYIKAEWLKTGTLVIDVGITYIGDMIYGDVELNDLTL